MIPLSFLKALTLLWESIDLGQVAFFAAFAVLFSLYANAWHRKNTREPDPIIGERLFVDGTKRPVFLGARGQYVMDDEGKPLPGVWIKPEDLPDTPTIVSHE